MSKKISLKALRGAGKEIVLKSEDGTEAITLLLKPIPFKKYLEISEKFETDNIDMSTDEGKAAAAKKNIDGMIELIVQTMKESYPDMTVEEINAELEELSFTHMQEIMQAVMGAHNLNAGESKDLNQRQLEFQKQIDAEMQKNQ